MAMNPYTAAIGGALALTSAAVGAAGSARENQEARRVLSSEKQKNKNWYDMKRAENHSSRADIQAVLNRTKEMFDERYNTARAANIVAGGSDEQLMMQQAEANRAVADASAQIAAQSSAITDAAEQQYRQQDAALNQQDIALHQAQAQQIAAAGAQGVSAGINLIGSGISSEPRKEVEKEPKKQ